ncbi:MAG: 1-(5-phosphoribosyl)-5-[(5-phosphoribosylamino)methylideneamino]imidazole-4-carboxamide isomerase [Acidobacteriota bacterium]|nr:1-(5-phosphoribosyl)-5-[(5-phosphoribosylamino)methylideneamino]imidazole-4-carboxamide isomerase [Acidobacteriota bacterium]
MIVIPAIDLIGGKCVRLYQGDFARQTTYEKDPVQQGREFQAVGFSRLHVVDLEGAREGTGQNRPVIQEVVKALKIPVQVGGGIRTRQDIAQLLGFGVSYLIVGTSALASPDEVTRWVDEWGPESLIVSLDLKMGKLRSEGWLEQSEVGLDEVCERIVRWGIPQVICTDVESDGTLDHPNYQTYEDLGERLSGSIQLIAAGGVSQPEHIARLKRIGVSGAVVGRALYEGDVAWEELIHAG